MKKILVITDLSAHSKAGLRFAIQLASQNNYKLTFFHVYRLLRPTSWSDKVLTSFENTEHAKIKANVYKFVLTLYGSSKPTEELDCVIQRDDSPERCIRRYAEENNYHYICASRTGTGKTLKLFGSTVSALIKKCSIPVISVPENYKRNPVTRITYVSDLMDIENELKKVADFAGALDVAVEMLHFKVPMDYLMEPKQLENIAGKLIQYHITAHFDALNYEETLIQNMNKIFKKTKPSLVVMFTKQNRSLFEKLFLSSISAEYAIISKMPLLIFKKSVR